MFYRELSNLRCEKCVFLSTTLAAPVSIQRQRTALDVGARIVLRFVNREQETQTRDEILQRGGGEGEEGGKERERAREISLCDTHLIKILITRNLHFEKPGDGEKKKD